MSASLASVIEGYLDLRWRMNPVDATMAGVHDHDARFADWSATGVREFAAAVRSYTVSLEETEAATLDDEIDRTAVLHAARYDLLVLERERPFARDPSLHVSHAAWGIAILALDPARDGAALDARIAALPDFFATARAALTEPAATLIDAARELVPALRALVRGEGGSVAAEAHESRSRADDAIVAFDAWLAESRDAATDDFAIGRQLFDRTLHTAHMITDNADVLARYADRLRSEAVATLESVARDIGDGRSWREVIAAERATRPESASSARAVAAAIGAWRAHAAHGILRTLPAGDCVVAPMPLLLRPFAGAAAYVGAGAVGDGAPATIFVDAALSVAESVVIAAHEGVPGRHVLRATARDSARPVRRAILSPVAEDGWALYAESLVTQEGVVPAPVLRAIGAWHLLRSAVAIRLDVELHTRDMSRDDAERLLRDEVGLDAAEARVAVRRICAMPTRALAAAIGRRDILALREDARRAAGSTFDLGRFHDDLLAYGALPTALARWGMAL